MEQPKHATIEYVSIYTDDRSVYFTLFEVFSVAAGTQFVSIWFAVLAIYEAYMAHIFKYGRNMEQNKTPQSISL